MAQMQDVTAILAALPDPFTTADATAGGISRHVLARLVRRCDVQVVRRGVYRHTHTLAQSGRDWVAVLHDHRVRVRAALTAHPGHAVSHQSAAALTGWPLLLHPDMPVHLTALTVVPRSRHVPGCILHHSDSVINDTWSLGGMLALTPARVAADCLRTMASPSGVAVVDGAVRAGYATCTEVEDMLAAQRHWVGRRRAVRGLCLVDPRRETWLESYSFVRLYELGIELPTPQVEVFDAAGRFVARVDGMWIDDGVVAEADGRGKYLIPSRAGRVASSADVASRVVDEKLREDALRALELGVVRWDTREMRADARAVAGRVETARRYGDIRRFTGRLRVDGRWIPTEHLSRRV